MDNQTKTDNLFLNWAWGRLLLMLVGAWVVSYLLFGGLMALSAVSVEGVFRVATGGVRNVSLPIVESGMSRGVPMGLMLFAVNFFVSIVFVLLLLGAPLLDPNAKSEFPSLFRRMLLKSTSLDKPLYWALGGVPAFRSLGDEGLRPLAVWLYVAPPMAMMVLGTEIGAVMAAVHLLKGSFLYAAAALVPHCVLELPALCLAGCLPFGVYRSLREYAEAGNVDEVFRAVRRAVRSSQVWIRIGLLPVLLLAAGLVESRLTTALIDWMTGGAPQ